MVERSSGISSFSTKVIRKLALASAIALSASLGAWSKRLARNSDVMRNSGSLVCGIVCGHKKISWWIPKDRKNFTHAIVNVHDQIVVNAFVEAFHGEMIRAGHELDVVLQQQSNEKLVSMCFQQSKAFVDAFLMLITKCFIIALKIFISVLPWLQAPAVSHELKFPS